MGPTSPVESYIAVKPAPDLGADVYTNDKKFPTTRHGGRTVFGGLLVSQAISAANATVPADFHVYSSQSSFVRAISDKANGIINYHIERTSSGRTYATRLVRAIADNVCVYIAIISFQSSKISAGSALAYNVPMPELDDTPEEISQEISKQFNASHTGESGGVLQAFAPEEKPFDWRPSGHILGDDPTESCLRGFVRARPLSTRSPAAHLAGLGYASDENLLGVAIVSNPEHVGRGGRNVAMVASLNHNISFHDPNVKVDEWMVCVRNTSWGADGRVLVHQRMWDLKSGRLVMTTEQEALVRLKNAKL
ncbi:Thioesterase/thiol ester dehydrase-isomerase [Annulohypoxylon maeteangense]|uniref:Thioesterase/thiol ester dehydrase-isomerase n=1 Tax=Annulohypoxylon maeteangense TaxID=1927788 RepID=UPI0020076391|nr:Thioesterase/thiol ester dehydrase-isomerase [Annulohypoxylon maeteangense]KAI0890574.1 Thioesterase/thiol ester dehydrase-isomerase [Annulohypoxylon maeteangense]